MVAASMLKATWWERSGIGCSSAESSDDAEFRTLHESARAKCEISIAPMKSCTER